MSNDPKKPFDAPPPGTPPLLTNDMNVDRRNRTVPGFDQSRGRPPPPPAASPSGQPARVAPPSPTQWANRPAAVRPAMAQPVFVQPKSEPHAPETEAFAPLGEADDLPTQVAPYNRPVAAEPLPAEARPAAGTKWRLRDPAAPVDPTPSAPPAHRAQTLEAPTERASAPPPLRAKTAASLQSAAAAPPAAASRAAPKATGVGQVRAAPASLFRRSVSWVVDLIVIGGLVSGLMFIAIAVSAPAANATLAQLEKVALPAAALTVLIAFVYSALFAFLWQGRTFGRRLVGIHLVDGTGSAPGPVRALFRAMLSLVSFALFLSGFWLALFDRKGQTLHDKLSRTFVVRLGVDAS